MNFQKKIYEGKAKTIFSGPKKNTLIQYFKDDATAFNAKKFQVLEGKGEINNLISEYLMGILSNNQISTHFIKKISNKDTLMLLKEDWTQAYLSTPHGKPVNIKNRSV